MTKSHSVGIQLKATDSAFDFLVPLFKSVHTKDPMDEILSGLEIIFGWPDTITGQRNFCPIKSGVSPVKILGRKVDKSLCFYLYFYTETKKSGLRIWLCVQEWEYARPVNMTVEWSFRAVTLPFWQDIVRWLTVILSPALSVTIWDREDKP